MKELIQALNSHDFMAFPRKDGKGVSLTVLGKDGQRYFLGRVATNEVDENGKSVYAWRVGNAMRKLD